VIHGDIKPQNMLVFQYATGKIIVKVADFGYSTLAIGEAGVVYLPKSRPWNAPEHHFGEFTPLAAKQTDVYSFGLLCLWVLFRNEGIAQKSMGNIAEFESFDAFAGPRTPLEQLKDDDGVERLASQLMESVPLADLSAENRVRLKEFFSLTVSRSTEKRTSDIVKLVGLLSGEQ
jgi:serine/threonine protein kinase